MEKKTGIEGVVKYLREDRMPRIVNEDLEKRFPGYRGMVNKRGEPRPIEADVYVVKPFKQGEYDDLRNNIDAILVKKTRSGSDGRYFVEVEEGEYTVLADYGEGWSFGIMTFEKDGYSEGVQVKKGEIAKHDLIQFNITC